MFFPTSLCGVLVFDSVSRSSSSSSAASLSTVIHHLSHTTLSHTSLSYTSLSHTTLSHTPSFTHNFVKHNFVTHTHTTLSHTIFHAAWHLATSTFVLRGRRGTAGTGLDLVARLVPVGRTGRRGTLRGRCGTWRHPPSSFQVAGLALGDIHLCFTCIQNVFAVVALTLHRLVVFHCTCVPVYTVQTDVLSAVTSLAGGAG